MDSQALPEVFGRYRVLKPLGRGAMGSVYLAEDTQLQRRVALKVPTFDGDSSAELLARFYREARSAATLRHPHICPVYDVGEIDGRHYISMAYLDGQPLSELIKAGRPPSERPALSLIRKLALALQEAHDHGIVHRDLKPANVMIDGKREPIIMDFGLACRDRDETARLTQRGMIIGSPAYMSPEQLDGDPAKLTAAVDQYSLGVILFELLTGQLPFRGGLSAVINQVATKPTPPLSSVRADIDPRIDALCRRMMAKSAAERFPSMKAVAEEITRILAAAAKPTEKPAPKPAATTSVKTPRATDTIVSDRDRWGTEIPTLLALAKDLYRKHDYAETRKVLSKIPAGVRTAEVEQLLSDAVDRDDECCLLLSDIDQALQQQTPADLQPMLKRLLQLKPGHKQMQQLSKDIERYGVEKAVKIRRKEDGFDDPAGRTIEPKFIAMVAGGLFALCASVYFAASALQTQHGTVIVNVADPNIAVTFADQKVTATETGKSFSLKPGEPKALQVDVHGVSITEATRTISVQKNETKTVIAKLQPDGSLDVSIVETRQTFTVSAAAVQKTTKPNVEPVSEDGGNWITLFDGENFSGWKGIEHWQIRDGAMEIHPDRITKNWALQTVGTWSDYEARFQYRLHNDGALALIMRYGQDAGGWNVGTHLNLGYFERRGQAKRLAVGDLFAMIDRKPTDLVVLPDELRQPLEPGLKRGEWLDVRVRCEGPRIVADINGVQTIDYVDESGKLPRSGTLAFYTRADQKAHAEVRNVRIRPLDKLIAATTPPSAPGSAPPMPTSTPASPASTRRVMFSDEYDRPQPYWSNTTPEQLKENPNHIWGYRDGIYYDETKSPGWYFGWLPGGPYQECTWELSSRIVGDQPGSRGGFVLYVMQSGRGVQVRIDGAGRLWIAPSSITFNEFAGGPWVGPIAHRAIKPGGAGYNKVRLDIRKRRLNIYVNDVAVVPPLEFEWDLTPAGLGMGVDCQSPSVRAEHDRVEIGELLEPPKPEDDKEKPLEPVRILRNGAAVLPDGTHCYEGTSLRVASTTGGTTNPQWDLQTFGGVWTNDCQMLWHGAKANNVLTIDLPIEAQGLYQIVPGFTVGPDFGRFKFLLDDKPLYGDQPIDLFDPVVQPAKLLSLGTLPLSPGKRKLTITAVGKNRGSTGFVFGLDELRLVPVR